MTRHICLVVAVEPLTRGPGFYLTLEHGDGLRAEYHADAIPCAGDDLLARAVELEHYPNPATNKGRVRTLTGDWFEVTRNYPRPS